MRPYLLLVLVVGCAVDEAESQDPIASVPGTSDVKADKGTKNVLATNCEIFIDKVQAMEEDHGGEALNLYIKTINSRLNGNIVEVGMRNKSTGTAPANTAVFHDWTNDVAPKFENSADYFNMMIWVGSDFASNLLTEGVFYVKTDHDTVYWLKPNEDDSRNYFLDENAFKNLLPFTTITNIAGADPNPNLGIPTAQNGMTYYNPGWCR